MIDETNNMENEIQDTESAEKIETREISELIKESAAIEKESEPLKENIPAQESHTPAGEQEPQRGRRPFFHGGRDSMDRKGMQKNPRYRKKFCRFCHNKTLKINYRDAQILEGFITERGKILPRRITGTCSKHQRDISRAIKQARILALLPFVVK